METIFCDKAKANTDVRNYNAQYLREHGFIYSGAMSRSGEMYIAEQKTQAKLVFGLRCNIGGKNCKYFSLTRTFKTAEEARTFFKNLQLKQS